jgi:hypothetical protein
VAREHARRGCAVPTANTRAVPSLRGRGDLLAVGAEGEGHDRGAAARELLRAAPAPSAGHTRTDAVARGGGDASLPSGLNARPVTSSSWPVNATGRGGLPSTRVTRALWSCEPVATSEPSGLNAATDDDVALVAAEHRLARGALQRLDRRRRPAAGVDRVLDLEQQRQRGGRIVGEHRQRDGEEVGVAGPCGPRLGAYAC